MGGHSMLRSVPVTAIPYYTFCVLDDNRIDFVRLTLNCLQLSAPLPSTAVRTRAMRRL